MMEREWAPGEGRVAWYAEPKWMCSYAQRSCKAPTGYPVDN